MLNSEYRALLLRANRQLGTALAEVGLAKVEDLETANLRLLELSTGGELRQMSLLSVLAFEKKTLREEDVMQHVVDDHGVGVVDLRGYDVPEEIKKDLDVAACWATWSVPFDVEEDFYFIATACYLSSVVRTYWEKRLGSQIVWQATSLENIAEFLERLQSEREEHEKRLKPKTGA